MKHNRWLVILVSCLLVINIAFFILVKYGQIDKQINNFLINTIEKKFNVVIDIEHLSLNDKQFFANKISIYDENKIFSLHIEQLHFDYDLLKLLFSLSKGLKEIPDKVLSEVRIYQPFLELNLDFDSKSNKLDFPEIYNLFTDLYIYNGNIKLQLNNSLIDFYKEFPDINIVVNNQQNEKKSHIVFSSGNNDEKINAEVFLEDNQSKKAEFYVKNFLINDLSFNEIGTLNTKAEIYLSYDKHFDYYLKFNELVFDLDHYSNEYLDLLELNYFATDSLIINGNENKLYIESEKINTNQGYFNVFSSIQNPFTPKEANFIANLKVKQVGIPFDKEVNSDLIFPNINFNGLFDLNLQTKGNYNSFSINSTIYSDSVKISEHSLKDINITVKSDDFLNKPINVSVKNIDIFNASLTGKGQTSLKQKSLSFDLKSKNASYNLSDLSVNTDYNLNISYSNKDDFKLRARLENLCLSYNDFHLNDLTSDIVYSDRIVIASTHQQLDDARQNFFNLRNETVYLIDENIINSDFVFNNYTFSSVNPKMPSVSSTGKLSFYSSDNDLTVLTDVSFGNRLIKDNFFHIIGNLNYINSIDSLNVKIHTENSFVNYTPFNLNFIASGSRSEIKSDVFNINDLISGSVKVSLEKDFYYELDLLSTNINISEVGSFLLNRNTASKLEGDIKLSLKYNSKNLNAMDLRIDVNSFKYNDYGNFSQFSPFDVSIRGNGQWSNLNIYNMSFSRGKESFMSSNLSILDYGKNVSFNSSVNTMLSKISDNERYSGEIRSIFSYEKRDKDVNASVLMNGKNIDLNNFRIDRINLKVLQNDKGLFFERAEIFSENDFDLRLSGNLNYNIFTNSVLADSSDLRMNLKIDPANLFKRYTNVIISGKTEIVSEIKIAMDEEGLVFSEGFVNLQNGWIRLLTQQEVIDRVNIKASISDNRLIFETFEARMGKGFFYLRNEFTDTDSDFQIANLNLGIFYIKTDETGILMHLPYYMPHNSVANAVIKGRNQNEAVITGPFDEILIIGDVFFSNGNGIYPSETENLLRMFDFVRSEFRTHQQNRQYQTYHEKTILPFRLDLIMHFTKNCKYVTYPMNLKTTPDSFLHLLYRDDGWFAYEADFKAEEGTIELFGTIFNVDYAQVRINPYEVMPTIFGAFYKKVADGTTITLEIFTDKTGNMSIWDSFKINLKSDNSDDKTITQILAKLRYGKSLEELSENQYQNILQDEAVHLLGVSIGSALLDPYISPLENRFRRLLRLDSFTISPGFIQNLISNKTWSDNRNTDSEIASYSSSILLNNLTITMGKYISNNLFLEYNTVFQEGTDLANNTSTYMYQKFIFRYDLPYKYKLRYTYEINPDRQDNAHEIFLLRSFKF